MSISLQIGRCFTAVPSSSSPSTSFSSNSQRRFGATRITCCSRAVAVLDALPSQINYTSTPPPSPPPTAAQDEDERFGTTEDDFGCRSGIKVPRQRHISVSKSELLDAIVSAMFSTDEEARQFCSLSQCLDLILHAEHKIILEEMRADFDDALHEKSNTFSPDDFQSTKRKDVVNHESGAHKNNSMKDNQAEMEQDYSSELSIPTDFTLDFKQFLDFSLETAKRNLMKNSRVPIPSRFQHAFMKLLSNAEFEELSRRDLILASALNTDYLLTLPIYVDWKKASGSSTIIFRRGYATETQKGLLIGEKLDYLQSKLLQSFFFPLFGKPLGKICLWLNEVFKSITKNLDPEVLDNKFLAWLKELSSSLKPPSYDEQMADNVKGLNILSSDFPIWVAAQKAVVRYEEILKVVGPRERLFKKFLAWVGLVPSTPKQAVDFDLDGAGSESSLSSSFLPRISLSDIWKPASTKSCGNDFRKMFRTAISILFTPSILQEPTFQELILLYTEENEERETTNQSEVPSWQMKIYESIPIPELPVVFPHKKLSFRILDTVRLDASTILGLLAYLVSYKFEDILSSPSAIILDVIAATALVIYVFRVALGYKLTRDRYQLLVNRTLYEKTVASGFGSIHFLLDASEQQLHKEAILAYAMLLQAENGKDRETSARDIGDKCEKFLYNVFEEKIEMPIEKAMKTLMRLGLATEKVVDGRIVVQSVSSSTALTVLQNRWYTLVN